jgi:transposase
MRRNEYQKAEYYLWSTFRNYTHSELRFRARLTQNGTHTVPVCWWHNEGMPKILYPQVIEEGPQELKELEIQHRYTHLFQRVRMLRLLKSGECKDLGEAAEALGYSWRQCQRWFASYREGGLKELLTSRVDERGRQELVTPEAFEELQEAMKRGEIATIREADEFLKERGIEYSHPDGVGQLLRRRKVKLKTGRPRHEKADPQEQEAFKKTSPRG